MKTPTHGTKLSRDQWRSLLGCLAVFASAFCFYMSTVAIQWSRASVAIDASYFVFARFLLGFIVVSTVMKVRNRRLVLKNHHLLIGRTLSNCAAVYCFFKAVTVTTVAEANIVNMTYARLIAIFTWVFLQRQRDVITLAMVLIAFVGVWLVLSPGAFSLKLDHTWGLMSGLTAAAAIIYLNISRQYHDTHTILFYMFGLGTVVIYLVFYRYIFFPDTLEFYYLVLCAAFGIAGQYLLTLGFRYVTAVEGGIISSTRILLAALLGPILVAEPA
ncbi:MAG: DMT family transporter, partial [Desulfobacterales bacterium]|nr:DMT family transporter [Desulfobacterales bacterium]